MPVASVVRTFYPLSTAASHPAPPPPPCPSAEPGRLRQLLRFVTGATAITPSTAIAVLRAEDARPVSRSGCSGRSAAGRAAPVRCGARASEARLPVRSVCFTTLPLCSLTLAGRRYTTAATCTSELTLPNYGCAAQLQRRIEVAMGAANAAMHG